MPPITTYASFVSELSQLAVADVSKRLTCPPTSLDTADLPTSWVQLPEGEEGQMTFCYEGGWPLFRCNYCIAIVPTAQDIQASAFSDTVDMMDNVAQAIRALSMNELVKSALEWTIRATVWTVAGIDYWGVLVRVTGHG